jgi:hypothetical protein
MRMEAAARMPVCPFCGVITEMPHENQQVCLEALAAEIARLRSVLEHSASAAVPGAPTPENDEPDET